jgi:hypothetical protein
MEALKSNYCYFVSYSIEKGTNIFKYEKNEKFLKLLHEFIEYLLDLFEKNDKLPFNQLPDFGDFYNKFYNLLERQNSGKMIQISTEQFKKTYGEFILKGNKFISEKFVNDCF